LIRHRFFAVFNTMPRSQGQQNQKYPRQYKEKGPPVQYKLLEGKWDHVKGKDHEHTAEDNKGAGGDYKVTAEPVVPAPARGKKGKAGKDRKEGPGFGKGGGDDVEGGEEEEKTDHEKKRSKKKIKGPFVQFNRENRAETADNYNEKGKKYRNTRGLRKGSKKKGCSEDHEEEPEDKYKPGDDSAGYFGTHDLSILVSMDSCQ
jgi:hypothetical protein